MGKTFTLNKNYDPLELPETIRFDDIFKENYEEHLFGLKLFSHANKDKIYARQFPDLLIFGQFDIKKFLTYITKTYKIKSANEINEVNIQKNKFYNDPNFAVFDSGLVIRFLNIDYEGYKANIYYTKEDKSHISFIKDIVSKQNRFKFNEKPIKRNNVHLLLEKNRGFEIEEFELTQSDTFDIDKNYNDDFKEIHELIVKSLNEKDKTGLVLLHGLPGTGKTTYIKYLTSLLDKKIVIINNNLASNIDSPSFLSFLIDHKNIILVIEDAEKLISNRNEDRYSAVSGLLNMTDGLLGQCLNIQVICTFNTDVKNIDEALMRRGRLITRYEFGKLKKEKANNILKEIGSDRTTDEDMLLTDIFNIEEKEFKKEEKKIEKIGFKFSA